MTRFAAPTTHPALSYHPDGRLTVDPGVRSVAALRSGPLGGDIAPRSMGSVTVGCGWVNKGDPWGERDTTGECTRCRKEVDPSGEGSHCVWVYLVLDDGVYLMNGRYRIGYAETLNHGTI